MSVILATGFRSPASIRITMPLHPLQEKAQTCMDTGKDPVPPCPHQPCSPQPSTSLIAKEIEDRSLATRSKTPRKKSSTDRETLWVKNIADETIIMASAGYDHTIRFWEALSGICSRTIQHPDSQVNRLCISPDKRFLAAASHSNVKLYDIKSTNPNPILTFEGHTSNITGVAFHCEGKWMVTSSEDGTVKIWETRVGGIQRSYDHRCPVNDVVIHPNQGEIVSCDRGGSVRIWDLAENNCSHELIPEDDCPVASVTVATDGSLLCCGNNNGNVFVWRMDQYRDKTQLIPITHFKAHNQYITRVLLSPDVKHLATCSADHTAKIWEVQENLAELPPGATMHPSQNLLQGAPGTSGINAPLDENGQVVTTVGEGQENAPIPFKLESTLTGHQRWVWDCAFSADSAYLVTACSDHYARLWELGSEQVIRQYNGHHRGAVCVALNDYSEGR